MIDFDIPAEPLDLALNGFGAAAGTQLLFDAAITEGHRANGLKGSFTSEMALRQLLAGTGIVARAIDDQGFTLDLQSPPSNAGANGTEISPMVRRFNAYSAAVQVTMHDVLCRNGETAPGSFRVLARVWIAASGLADQAELLTSSGDLRRDAMLMASFRTLTFEVPPADLPQPITLLITSDGLATRYCPEPQRAGQRREAVR